MREEFEKSKAIEEARLKKLHALLAEGAELQAKYDAGQIPRKAVKRVKKKIAKLLTVFETQDRIVRKRLIDFYESMVADAISEGGTEEETKAEIARVYPRLAEKYAGYTGGK